MLACAEQRFKRLSMAMPSWPTFALPKTEKQPRLISNTSVRGAVCAMWPTLWEAACENINAKAKKKKFFGHYFKTLKSKLVDVDTAALETEWRALYPFAWADFQRFLLGWSPGHRKLNSYSQRVTDNVVENIIEELLQAAITGCLKAGEYIRSQQNAPLRLSSKGLGSQASDIVTQVDIEAQRIILDALQESIDKYDLGVLAEEGKQDQSRHDKHAFWTIDPLDGTLFLLKESGFRNLYRPCVQNRKPHSGCRLRPCTRQRIPCDTKSWGIHQRQGSHISKNTINNPPHRHVCRPKP